MPINGTMAHWVFSLRGSVPGKLAGTVLLAEAAAPRASVAVVGRGDSLILSGPRGLRFAGVRSASKDSMVGSVTFGGATSPTSMVRIVRPQRVRASVPYRTRDLTISSSDSVRLSATLTLPEGRGPFPAVALTSGSGPQDRNATIFFHEPFALIADYFARTGIATASAALAAHPVVTPTQP